MDLAFFTNFAADITQQEAQINTLQEEVASGVTVQTPDQGPAAYETATIGNDQISALTAEQTNQATIQSQLGSVSDVYQSVSTLYDNVQSVIEQALNGTTSAANQQSLAPQITSAGQLLVSLGNTTGANGTYLFGGSRGNVAPFQASANGSIVYLGDAGSAQAAITPDSTAATGANGEAFVDALSGDGTATVTANTNNTGTAVLLSQGVENPAAASAFQTGSAPITLSFANGANGLTYTARQSGRTLQTGAVTAGATLQLAGTSYQLTGTPAAGDKFTLSPSRPQSAFTLLQSVATTLAGAGTTPAEQAQTRQQLNNDLSALSQYQQSVLTAQAQTGVTLQAVSAAGTANTTRQTAIESSVQSAVGTNMPTALATLDQTLTSVQAAMKAFGSVQNLSLFNYL